MFKKLFNPKQNQDPTLNEKGWGIFKLGRLTSWVVLILGTAIVYLLSSWITNAFEALIVAVCSSQVGFFSGHGDSFTWTFLKMTLFHIKPFIENENLLNLLDVAKGHSNILLAIHWLIFAGIWYFSVWKIFFTLFTKSRSLNHHEYGKSRLATPKEVAEQTYKVPDRTDRYDLPNGFPVMHSFNWRGNINKWVKTQFSKTETITKVRQQDLSKIFVVASTILGLFIFFIISGIRAGSVQYNNNQMISGWWLIPFYIWHYLAKTVHGIYSLLWHACHSMIHLQTIVFKQPFYTSGLFFLVEALIIGWLIFHLVDGFHAFKRGFIYSFIGYEIKRIRNVVKLIFNKSARAKAKPHEKHHLWKSFKRAYHKRMSFMSLVKGSADEGENTVHATSAFFHHPLATSKLALMEVIQVLIPLESGITGWYYLSPRPHNVLVYGTSGSGKGQMIVNPVMDINSRTSRKYQPNMIVTDPKGESASGAYEMLKRRGYDVKVMNILDLSHSMSFNPLRLVIKDAQLGAVGQAADACSQLSDTIYDATGTGPNSYFYTSAGSLFDAMTFALLSLVHSRYYGLDNLKTYNGDGKTVNVHEDGLGKRDKNGHTSISVKDGIPHSSFNAYDKITILNILHMASELGGEIAHVHGAQDTTRRLIIYFTHLAHKLSSLRQQFRNSSMQIDDVKKDQITLMDQAVNKFQQFKMAGSKEASSIFSTFINRLRIYQSPDTAKMTSEDNFNPAEMGFDRLLTIQFNRLFQQQHITARSWSKKPIIASVNKSSGKVYYKNDGNDYYDDRGHKHKSDENDVLEINNSHLSVIGLAQIPFSNPIPHDKFFVTIDLHNEIVNYDFHFTFKCTKEYYSAETVHKDRRDYQEAPKVASIDIVCAYVDRNGKIKKDDNGRILYAKDEHGNPVSKSKVPSDTNTKVISIDRYTKQTVLKDVHVANYDLPEASIYETMPSRDNTYGPKLAILAQDPDKAVKIHEADFLYNPRPTAWFVVAPQNKQTLNQLGTFAIDQTFNVLSNISMKYTNGRHVQRPVQMILDELGNLPAIPHLDRKSSFGRSQHIYLMPIFQSKSQSLNVYGPKVTATVFENCPTTVFILSNSSDTIKDISGSGGDRTVSNTSLSHNPTKMASVDYNSNSMKQSVLPPDVLKNLRLGEAVILRTTDRSDLMGHDTSPLPIFDWDGKKEEDNGKYKRVASDHRLPYAWWFLGKSFGHGSLGRVPIVTPHKYLDLETLNIPFNQIYQWMEVNEPLDTTYPQKLHDHLQVVVARLGDSAFKDYYTVEIANAGHLLNKNDALSIRKGLKELIKVQKQMKTYHPLVHMNKAVQAGQFVLTVLSHNKSELHLLTDPSFKAISIEQINGLVNTIRHYSIRDTPEETLKQANSILDSNPTSSLIRGLISHASHLNNTIIGYLTAVKLLHSDGSINKKLTKPFVDNPSIAKGFFTKYPLEFDSQIPVYKVINTLIQGLNTDSKYRNNIGFLFLMDILDPRLYNGFAHTKRGDPIKMNINSYVSIVLSLFDAFVTAYSNNKQTQKLKGVNLKISDAYSDLLTSLNHDDSDL